MVCSRLIVALVCLFASHECFSQVWVTVSPDSRVSIDFPIKPDSSRRDSRLLLVASDSGCVYTLLKTVVKDSDPGFNYQNLVYSNYAEALNKTEGITILNTDEFEVNGLPGKYFYYKQVNPGSAPKFDREKVFYFDGTLYSYSCSSSDTNNLPSASAVKFLESFKINTRVSSGPTGSENSDLYTKFRFGHLVFSGVFAVIAFALYLIWKKRGNSGAAQKWL